MSNYPEKLQNVLDALSLIPDETERVSLLIDYADKFKEVPPEVAKKPYPEENKVPFCESGAYVWTRQLQDGSLKFYFAVENPQGVSAKALAAILDNTLSGESAKNILNISEDVIYNIFGQGLSMGKNMGLTGIIQMIKREVKNLQK